MRRLLPLLACGAALSACYPEVDIDRAGGDRPDIRALTRLTCPEQQGEFRRLSTAADGRSCAYTAPNGGEVSVRLVALNAGNARAALEPIEAELRQVVPAPTPRPEGGRASQTETRSDVNIDLPFMEIEAGEESARVRMPGMEVDANGDDATVNIGGDGGETVRVNSRDGASEVRVNADGNRSVQATYILTRDAPTAAGWRSAGYQARGPLGGPLVVATAKMRSDSERVFDDLEALVDRSFDAPATTAAR